MKKSFFVRPHNGFLHTLMTFLSGVGCVLPLMLVMQLTADASLILAACGAVTLMFAVLDWMPRLRVLSYPLLLAAMALLLSRYAGSMQALANALVLFINGQPIALVAYSRLVALFLSLLFTGIGASFSRDEHAFFPLAFLALSVLFLVSFLGAQVPPAALLPIMAALLLSCRAPSVSTLRILPCAAAALALATLFMPFAGRTLPALTDFAKDVRQAIGDYLFFTDARTTFSLASTGFQPLGAHYLGGAASPTDAPVMDVYTTGRTLLRGTVKNTYTGHAWADTTAQNRYLFIGTPFNSLRRDLFDLARPDQAIRDSILHYEPITVSMRMDAASTLFLTQRFTSPTGEGIVAYYSPSTEVFATRSLEKGARYTFTGSRLSGDTRGVRDAVLSSYDEGDPYLPTVRSLYCALPQTLDPQALTLARQITAEAENDFDRAALLCRYLQTSFPYTLEQNVPPRERDFVSWFLFDEQKGYCTSFASAMAVMGRAVGLPTRYIEGYAATPDADDIARVTQENGHAWVEVYFPGFGWLSFDPTPGTGFAPDGFPEDPQAPSANMPDAHPDNLDIPDASESPDPTPSANPTPSESPEADAPEASATPSPSPTPTPHGEPENEAPPATPTPRASNPPSPRPDEPDSPPPPQDESEDKPLPRWPLAAALLIFFLIALRLRFCTPARVAKKARIANDALLVWYHVCTEALLCMGIAPLAGEAPASFIDRAQTILGETPNLYALGKSLCISRYSAHTLARVQVERAEKTYRALLARLKPHQRLRLYARRFFRGIHT